ncbi:hypothetical protein ACIPPQ_20330 [Sphingopyxis sp. LARHCG72]
MSQVRILPPANLLLSPEIIPAETIQADEAEHAPRITLRFAIGLAVLATALIGAHVVWASTL